ncbi:unnamed protein product [Phytophthora fragariaefolia]|uniref:Unnamed protein product n=1 Tax=Phytophthora fragariaefolia TaxID=1490495 RepID=A0A9W6XKN5_9STRA|nr:unnamed protein product [Phytophthora fragariaefolia]
MFSRISKPPTTKLCCARTLRQLHQGNDIEDYNGKYSALIFRVENMSEVDQVSHYCDGLKRATQAYVRRQNTMTLSEAMVQAVKYETSHFDGDSKTNRVDEKFKFKFLLACGATTVYVSRGFVNKHKLKTRVYPRRIIRGKLGDNKIGEAVLELAMVEIQLKRVPKGDSAMDISTSCGKCSQAIGAGLHDAVDSDRSTTRSHDCCRAAAPETQSECEVETAERPAGGMKNLSRREKKNVQVKTMFTLGVVNSEGVETKYLTRKKLREFLQSPAKDQPEHDFMIVLTNDIIKEIDRDIKRNDEPDNVGSKKTSGSHKLIDTHSKPTQPFRCSKVTRKVFSCRSYPTDYQ